MLNQKDLYSYAMKGVNPFVVKKMHTVDIKSGYYGDLNEPLITEPGTIWNALPPGAGKSTYMLNECAKYKTCFIFPNISLMTQNITAISEEQIVNGSKQQVIKPEYQNIKIVQLEHFIKMTQSQLEEFEIIVFDEFQMLVEESFRHVIEPAVDVLVEQAKRIPVHLLSATITDNMIMMDIDTKINSLQGFPKKDIRVVKIISNSDDTVKKSTRTVSNILTNMWYKHKVDKDFRIISIFNSDASNERVGLNLAESNIKSEIISSDRFKDNLCPEYRKMIDTKNSANMDLTCIASTSLMESGVSDLNPNAHVVTEQCFAPKIIQRIGRTRNNNVSTIIVGAGDEPIVFEYAPFIESAEMAKDLGRCAFKNRILAWLCDTADLMQTRYQRTKYGMSVVNELVEKYNCNIIEEYFEYPETQGIERGSKPKFVEALMESTVGNKFNIKSVWNIQKLMELTKWKRSVVNAHSKAYMDLYLALENLSVERDFKLQEADFALTEQDATIKLASETNQVYEKSNKAVIESLHKLNLQDRLSKVYDVIKPDVKEIIQSLELYNKAYQAAKMKSSRMRAEYKDELAELREQQKALKEQDKLFRKEITNIMNIPDEDGSAMRDLTERMFAHQEAQEKLSDKIYQIDSEAKGILEDFNNTASYPVFCVAVASSLGLELSKSDAMRLMEILVGADIIVAKKPEVQVLTSGKKKALQRKLRGLNIDAARRDEFKKYTGKTDRELVELEEGELKDFADKFFNTSESENFIDQIKF